MPGAEQLDDRLLRRPRPDPVHLGGEARAGTPEVEVGERRQVLAQGGHGRPDERRQLVEDALLLGLDRQLRLAPRVAQLDHRDRFDEERLPAARLVVDDALDLALGLGPHGDDVAAVAQGDDRLLEGARQLRAVDEVLEAGPEALVRDAHVAAQAPERRRRRVEQLAGRVDAHLQATADVGQRLQAPAQLPQERPSLLGQDVAQPRDRVEGDHDVHQLERLQPAGPGGTFDGWADVARAADTDARSLREQVASLVGLVEPACDQDRVRTRLDRLRKAPRRPEAGRRGEAFADRRELEELDRLAVHGSGPGREWPRERRVAAQAEAARAARPSPGRRRRRRSVGRGPRRRPAQATRRVRATVRLARSGRCRRGRGRCRRPGRRCRGQRRAARTGQRVRPGRSRRDRRVAASPSGMTARTSTAPAVPGEPATMLRHVCSP